MQRINNEDLFGVSGIDFCVNKTTHWSVYFVNIFRNVNVYLVLHLGLKLLMKFDTV